MSRCARCTNGKQAGVVSAKVSILFQNPEFSKGKPFSQPLYLTLYQK